MTRTLIVGFGSPFGDDQFGWLVIEQLQKALKDRNDVRTICCDHSGTDWLHQYQPVEHLIFVDAVKSNAKPGTRHHRHIKPAELDTLPTTHSSHGIGLREGIALAMALVELPTEIIFYGVELEQYGANSPASSTTIEQVKFTTRKILNSHYPG